MRIHGIKRCMHIDSDVMLYDNMDTVERPFSQFDFTLSKGHCGHCSFWTLPPLDALAETNMRLFRDKGEDWKWMLDKIGNTVLSDMITLEFMRLKSGFSAGDTSGIIDGTTFDHNFTISQQTFSSYLEHDRGYQMPEWQMAPDGLSKAIVWRDRKPFGRLLGNEVRFVAIHCSGSAKALIPNLYRA